MQRAIVGVVAMTLAAAPLALTVGAPGAAADPAPTPYVLGAALPSAAHMTTAGGLLWITPGRSGSTISVLDLAGTHVADVPNQPGAAGVVVSGDGARLYVALSSTNAISVIDTASRQEVSRLTVDSCPSSLAFSSGRLFYSYGCNPGSNTAGVASVDPTNPGTPVSALTSRYSAPLLAGTATELVVGTVGLSPSNVDSYSTAADGTLTHDANDRTNENLLDMAVAPDGSHLLTASGAPYQITEFALPSLAQTMVFSGVAYPQAVAVSPDGSRIAGGFHSYGDTVHLYDATSGAVLWERFATTGYGVNGWDKPFDAVLPGTLVFAPDGSEVYGLVADQNNAVHLFRSTLTPTATSASIAVPTVAYGKTLTASLHTSGVASGTMTLTRTSNGGTTSLGAVSFSNGAATKSFSSTYSGSVQALYVGDAAHLPAVAKASYTTASRTTIAMLNTYKTVKGVRYYHSYKDVHVRVGVMPKVNGRAVIVTLWRRSGGSWSKRQTLTTHCDASGNVYLYLKMALPTGVLNRFTARFAGDSFNRGSKGAGASFVIR